MPIEIAAAEGTAEALVARPSTGAGPFPGVILYMDAFGLRPRIQDMAQRVADWGYIVLAPNVFYREGKAGELAPASGHGHGGGQGGRRQGRLPAGGAAHRGQGRG
jgi:carboxymethylenebutenolidase